MNNAVLYPYQRRWIDDTSRFKVGMFARQTGKTFTTTLEIAEAVAEAEIYGGKTRWVILSRGERQACEAMDEGVKLHLRAMGQMFEDVESDFRLADRTTIKAMEIVTAGGSRVTALPANADTARGFSANVFLDEFAFHQDSRRIWAALFPVVSRSGLKLRVVSTPNGKSNKFYELMAGNENSWSRHIVDIHQAVADGLPRDIGVLRGKTFAEQDAVLDSIFERYRVGRCCMDQTGMGEKPVEDAQRRHGTSRVEGVLFTGPNKLALATVGKQAFEDCRVRIPKNHSELRADLHKLKKVAGPTGAPRFVAESDANGHADRTWALFLALSAAQSPAYAYGYTPVKELRQGLQQERMSMRPRHDDYTISRRGIW